MTPDQVSTIHVPPEQERDPDAHFKAQQKAALEQDSWSALFEALLRWFFRGLLSFIVSLLLSPLE